MAGARGGALQRLGNRAAAARFAAGQPVDIAATAFRLGRPRPAR
jgi:hypothetical protein